MNKKLKTMLLPKKTKNAMTKYQIALFLLFFILLTAILASDLFQSKLNIESGEPSPELITAPYEKKVTDLAKFQEEQKAAANAVGPVYMADDDQISNLSKDLDRTFEILADQKDSKDSLTEKMDELRKKVPYSELSNSTLEALLNLSDHEIVSASGTSSVVILGIASDAETGARYQAEVSLLQDRMSEQINQSNVTEPVKELINEFIEQCVIKPTLTIDEEATKKMQDIAISKVKPSIRTYRENEKIIGPGEIVDDQIYQALQAYGLIKVESPWKPASGIAMIVLVSMIILILFAYQFSPDTFTHWQRMVLIGLLMIVALAMGKAFMAISLGDNDLNTLTAILIPAAWVTMTVTLLLGVKIAVLVGVILAIFTGMMADPGNMGAAGSLAALFSLLSGIVGIQGVAKLDRRSELARAGLFVALVNIALVSGVALILQISPTDWLIGCMLSVANGFLTSVLTMGVLPWLEQGFNITSAVRLLELSNPNAPLLKSLLIEAPGTYHHSVLVGNLAETAAEEIKADPVLVRVGALYHDIGKLKRPYFFIENQFSKDNPHEKIAPTLSSLIIISHIKDGLEMAKEHKLPSNIQDIIAQHHGDSTASFFYHKALEENPDISEEAFRYDGQRPQSKEAALVLLADNVEAAVRSQKDSSPGKIEGLVRKIIKEKFDEGLLDQCDLTFKDLDKISIAFVKVLSGIFHSRIEYPELPSAKTKVAEEAGTGQKQEEPKTQKENESPTKQDSEPGSSSEKNNSHG
ncbi:MAG: HDIG domain-containing protein [Dehalobacter sp.]|nr:HDIG domain-containing protein [Dehalobacter sp.]